VLETQKKQTFEWFSCFKHGEASAGICEHSAENLEEVLSSNTI